jgi:hypothetical protein
VVLALTASKKPWCPLIAITIKSGLFSLLIFFELFAVTVHFAQTYPGAEFGPDLYMKA